MDKLVRDWYMEAHPDDFIGECINPKLTFRGLYEAMAEKRDIYQTLEVGDSIVRELVMQELADRMGVYYDAVYNLWLYGTLCPVRVESVTDPMYTGEGCGNVYALVRMQQGMTAEAIRNEIRDMQETGLGMDRILPPIDGYEANPGQNTYSPAEIFVHENGTSALVAWKFHMSGM